MISIRIAFIIITCWNNKLRSPPFRTRRSKLDGKSIKYWGHDGCIDACLSDPTWHHSNTPINRPLAAIYKLGSTHDSITNVTLRDIQAPPYQVITAGLETKVTSRCPLFLVSPRTFSLSAKREKISFTGV